MLILPFIPFSGRSWAFFLCFLAIGHHCSLLVMSLSPKVWGTKQVHVCCFWVRISNIILHFIVKNMLPLSSLTELNPVTSYVMSISIKDLRNKNASFGCISQIQLTFVRKHMLPLSSLTELNPVTSYVMSISIKDLRNKNASFGCISQIQLTFVSKHMLPLSSFNLLNQFTVLMLCLF
jgi:hypothetical protein